LVLEVEDEAEVGGEGVKSVVVPLPTPLLSCSRRFQYLVKAERTENGVSVWKCVSVLGCQCVRVENVKV
jgi:hypothetical protein